MDWEQYEHEHQQRLENAREHAATLRLDEIDVAHWDLMRFDTIWPYYERLRQESPVFFHERSIAGPYWSVTSYDLVKAVDTDAARFSSEPSIGLFTPEEADDTSSFIAMDDPKHAEHRKVVAPVSLTGVIRKEPAGTLFSTLGEWTADASWASAAGSLVSRSNAILLFNDTEEPATMAVPPGSWTLPDGSTVGATLSLQPFSSAVLVTAAAVAPSPPYYAASGIDWRADTPVETYLGNDSLIFADDFESGHALAWIVATQ